MDELTMLREAWQPPAPAAAPVRARARARLLELASAGGAGQAARRQRRIRLPRSRPWLIAAGAASVAAAAAGVVVSAAVTVPATGGGHRPAVTTAYVVGQAGRALAAVEGGSAIQQTRFTARAHLRLGANLTPPQRTPAWLGQINPAEIITWSYRDRIKVAGFTAGRLLFQAGPPAPAGRQGGQPAPGYVLVNSIAASWYYPLVRPAPAQPRLTCGQASKALYNAPFLMSMTQASSSRWTALIRQALGCGLFRLDGRQRVDGIDAIRLTATPPEVSLQQGAHEVLWVSPKTFLPVRMSFGPRSAAAEVATADFRWLPPTAANLARLQVTIPPGVAGHRLPAGTGIVFWQIGWGGR